MPTLAPGCGPFPQARGGWEPGRRRRPCGRRRGPLCGADRRCSLDLIGARELIVIEGRFAGAQVFVRALATLRPEAVHVARDGSDVSYGALRLVDPALRPAGRLTRVPRLELDLEPYRREWRVAAERLQQAA